MPGLFALMAGDAPISEPATTEKKAGGHLKNGRLSLNPGPRALADSELHNTAC